MRFPLLRTAVKLSLIVLLTIQPVVTLAAVAECGTAENARQGCGCCEVDNATASCACCGEGVEGSDAPTHPRGCCTNSDGDVASQKKLQRPAVTDRSEASSEARIALHAVANDAGRTITSGVQRSCSCQQSSQPLSDGNSSRTSPESRQPIALGYLNVDATTLGLVSLGTNERHEGAFSGSEHGAQILLCIWRL